MGGGGGWFEDTPAHPCPATPPPYHRTPRLHTPCPMPAHPHLHTPHTPPHGCLFPTSPPPHTPAPTPACLTTCHPHPHTPHPHPGRNAWLVLDVCGVVGSRENRVMAAAWRRFCMPARRAACCVPDGNTGAFGFSCRHYMYPRQAGNMMWPVARPAAGASPSCYQPFSPITTCLARLAVRPSPGQRNTKPGRRNSALQFTLLQWRRRVPDAFASDIRGVKQQHSVRPATHYSHPFPIVLNNAASRNLALWFHPCRRGSSPSATAAALTRGGARRRYYMRATRRALAATT